MRRGKRGQTTDKDLSSKLNVSVDAGQVKECFQDDQNLGGEMTDKFQQSESWVQNSMPFIPSRPDRARLLKHH